MEKLKVWQFDHDGQVIYGDTDSIMIHTGLDDLAAAKNIAVKVIKEVQVLPIQ
jgi:DNA polymerase elongation subunit (family B)